LIQFVDTNVYTEAKLLD